MPGHIKQGGGPDSAGRPCVCHLCSNGWPLGSAVRAQEGVDDLKTQLGKYFLPIDSLANVVPMGGVLFNWCFFDDLRG